jgi:16S rRNA (guanine527-N7)-methyltransferase
MACLRRQLEPRLDGHSVSADDFRSNHVPMTQYVKALNSLGLDPTWNGKLTEFVDIFGRWNAKINLSAARTEAEIASHVVDSLHVAPLLVSAEQALDVGSGGGFPVVIAAICVPTCRFVSLEPVHKKHAFLRTAARELGLTNLEPLAVRLEDHPVFNYDLAMSRATFDLSEWLQRGLAFVHEGGAVLGFEAQLREDLPPTIERHPYSLEGKQRSIVMLRK